MKTSRLYILTALSLTWLSAGMVKADDSALIAQLSQSKISLLQGIAQAERDSGPATSAKFEIGDDGKLSLSIYTAPQGLGTPAEANSLTELSGDPTTARFAPNAEVFTDKEHIARASVHLTVMQMSKFTLSQIIQRALAVKKGLAYSVANPMVRSGEPVADVSIVDAKGKVTRVTVNVRTGKTSRN